MRNKTGRTEENKDMQLIPFIRGMHDRGSIKPSQSNTAQKVVFSRNEGT